MSTAPPRSVTDSTTIKQPLIMCSGDSKVNYGKEFRIISIVFKAKSHIEVNIDISHHLLFLYG